ncbi:hypothetical protein F4810DRAFT_695007 [Camillea tinctor]|nr:hypothetical protein F4810DRAFT_695007 [Camillea tinctor]
MPFSYFFLLFFCSNLAYFICMCLDIYIFFIFGIAFGSTAVVLFFFEFSPLFSFSMGDSFLVIVRHGSPSALGGLLAQHNRTRYDRYDILF